MKSEAMMRRLNGRKKCQKCGDMVKMSAFAGHVKACERKLGAATKATKLARKQEPGSTAILQIGAQRFRITGDFGDLL